MYRTNYKAISARLYILINNDGNIILEDYSITDGNKVNKDSPAMREIFGQK